MKLKRLEIIGFKSFMEKTVVNFDRDVTGIVGPNGCGKSNIVDAIRWVMGEMSAKHLRGKSMEDVVFAGSENHSPLSMASVELTFSTEGYQTPAAYLNHSEISVCRRLYRTGESEYFINKVQVRLKDITDLFLGTGVGTKAYSIIEQGRVGFIVTAKPEDRRFLIEEVAGISKFKSRRDAALRKMEATEQNLLRLNDLTTEIERQMNSLNRQAKKAEKYQEVKNEFQKLDLSVLSYQYQHDYLTQETIEKSLQEKSQAETEVKNQLLEEENSIESFRLEQTQKEATINQIQNDSFELTNYIRLAENTLHHKKDERSKLSASQQSLEAEAKELAEQIEGFSLGLTQINDQKCEADLDVEVYDQKVKDFEHNLISSQQTKTSYQQEIEQAQTQLQESSSRVAQIETLKHNLIHKQKEISEQLQLKSQELEQATSKNQKLSRVYKEAFSSLETLKQLKLDLNAQTDKVFEDLNSYRDNLKQHEQSLASLKEELTLKKSRLASLEELQKNFEGYQEGTRSVLLKKQEISPDGIYGTIAEYLETEPEYEGAVSAVLGEKLQHIVVKNHQQGLEAIHYLDEGSHGRTSFIPMTVRTYEDESVIENQEGVLGPLANFVSLKKDYNHLKKALFGDVVLVKDLDKALQLWSANGHRKTLVTMKGEVVDSSGVITGGSLADTSKVLLEKKREMKELGILIGNLENDLKDKEVKRLQLEKHVEDLNAHLESIKQSSQSEEINIVNQEKDVGHLKKEIDTIDEEQKRITSSLDTLKQTDQETTDELKKLEEENTSLADVVLVLKNQIQEKKIMLEEVSLNFEDQSEELTRLKVQLAQAGERKTHLDKEIDRLLNDRLRAQMKVFEQQQEQQDLEKRDEFLDVYTQHITRMLEKRMKAQSEIASKLNSEKSSFDQLSQTIREKEAKQKTLRKDHDTLAADLNDASVKLTQLRGDIKHYIEQCLERHQLSLTEIYKDHYDDNLNLNEAKEQSEVLRNRLFKMGDVNTAALQEYEELKERYDFMKQQVDDLEASLRSLNRVINKINRTTKEKFASTFDAVNKKFQTVFPKLFRGGQAKLVLTDEDNILETGVEVIAQPPGKKLQSMNLLSGGEKALTAVSLIFSIFQIKPSPFCLLDEVDAPLDDVNVGRYNEMIRSMTSKSQFVLITHNKRTMQMTDVLYGVTMQEPGVSQMVSVEMN